MAVSTGIDKLMNIPVELLIQQFAHHLQQALLAKLSDYPTAFADFLNSPESGLGEDWYIKDNIIMVLENLYRAFMSLDRQADGSQSFEQVLDQAVHQVSLQWQPTRQEIAVAQLNREQFIDQYNQKITSIINDWFKQLSTYGPNTNGGVFARQLLMPSQNSGAEQRSVFSSIYPQLFDIIRGILTTSVRQNFASVYFVGMGGQQAFGGSQVIELYGYLGQLLTRFSKLDHIDQDHNQLIYAVSTYTQQSVGAQLLQQGLPEVAFQKIAQLLVKHGMQEDDQKRVLSAVRQSMNNHNYGIRKTIINLSPTELARMSRTMVEANSFVARYSIRNAGVGGDIETIIITYQNGTTWVHWQNQFDVTDKEGKQ